MDLLSKSWSEVAFFDSNVFRVGVLCSVCFSGLHGSRIHSNFIGFRYVSWVLVLFMTKSSHSFWKCHWNLGHMFNSLPKILAWWLHTCVYLLPGSGSFWWRWWTNCLWLTLMRLWVHLLPSCETKGTLQKLEKHKNPLQNIRCHLESKNNALLFHREN
jgi:hypothetical protein